MVQEWGFGGRDGGEGESFIQPIEATLSMDDGDSLVDAAMAGLGILQAHDYAMEEAVSQGKLVHLLSEFDTPGPVVSVLPPQRKALPKVRAFTQFVQELLEAA
jgi:LysR family transcriptional regulator for bpeEF and oprC